MHAFEPVPPVADICRANVAQYMPQGFTVCVFEAAIGNAVDGLDPNPTVVDPWITTSLNQTLPLNNPNLQNHSNTTP